MSVSGSSNTGTLARDSVNFLSAGGPRLGSLPNGRGLLANDLAADHLVVTGAVGDSVVMAVVMTVMAMLVRAVVSHGLVGLHRLAHHLLDGLNRLDRLHRNSHLLTVMHRHHILLLFNVHDLSCLLYTSDAADE